MKHSKLILLSIALSCGVSSMAQIKSTKTKPNKPNAEKQYKKTIINGKTGTVKTMQLQKKQEIVPNDFPDEKQYKSKEAYAQAKQNWLKNNKQAAQKNANKQKANSSNANSIRALDKQRNLSTTK